MSTITPLPIPPTTNDPANFDDRADQFLGQLPTFASETNIVAAEVLSQRDEVASNTGITLAAKDEAVAASVTAQSVAAKWLVGTTYAQGDAVWSPISFLTYRKITAGSAAGGTDPSINPTTWVTISSYIPSFVLLNFGVI